MKAFGVVVSARLQWNCWFVGPAFDNGRVHVFCGPLSVTLRRHHRY